MQCLVKGNLEDVPQLPPLPWNTDDEEDPDGGEDDEEDDETKEIREKQKIKHKSGPKTVDPYASETIFP
ncbi:hypothetical protein BSL78_12189 [Apostichopus japonicus]|uniref:Uncharacterized protein n=1 Tax=Stichopus japonicus TaxID=307972 RepID=A0A2G8KSF3_STIJA|nr:hypothetical protein BSL78_12189 [Apostichopus japonicus]